MKKVLLISDKIEHYRVPLFNTLADEIELTIATLDNHNFDFKFKTERIKITKVGPFVKYKNLNLKEYDVVIYPFNVRVLNLLKDIFSKRTYRLGAFGIGVSASYTKRYDQKASFQDFLRKLIIKNLDFAIFYESYPFVKYKALGISPNKMSIAYNTVAINPYFDFSNKTYESFLFIGSLYKQKKVIDLIIAYHKLTIENTNTLKLEIVGNGEEYFAIEKYIKENNLSDRVVMHGSIERDDLLLPIMNRSVVCVSPGQAGLSVQKCFSYGIGFITTHNAITGGEAHSIIDGVNGNFYDGTIEDLKVKMKLYLDKSYSIKVAKKAFMFYNEFRTVDIWKNGFLKNVL